MFCISIDRNQMNATRRSDLNVVAEVVDRSSSGGFTSRLVRQNISTELNNTVLGCSRSQNMDIICRPSSTDLNPNFSLAVTVCQGNDNSGKQYICNVSHFHQLQLLVYWCGYRCGYVPLAKYSHVSLCSYILNLSLTHACSLLCTSSTQHQTLPGTWVSEQHKMPSATAIWGQSLWHGW